MLECAIRTQITARVTHPKVSARGADATAV